MVLIFDDVKGNNIHNVFIIAMLLVVVTIWFWSFAEETGGFLLYIKNEM